MNVGQVAHWWLPRVEKAHMQRLCVVQGIKSEVARASVFWVVLCIFQAVLVAEKT